MAGILTRAARILLTIAIKESDLHIAFATGLTAWDSLEPYPFPPYDIDQTDVTGEFVRKSVLNKQFVLPNEFGEIITDRGNFSFADGPTEHLYIKATLEPTEFNTQTIREFGLFSGSVMVEGLPSGQMLFTPEEVADKGILVIVRRTAAIVRSSTTRQLCELVWTV